MPELWTVEEALGDLAALEPELEALAASERPAAAARWFARKYGRERGAQVFVLFVRLGRWLARNPGADTGDRAFFAELLAKLGARGGDALEVPQPLPPEDKPEG